MQTLLHSFLLSIFIFSYTIATACVDPETVITVQTNYSEDLTDVEIRLGNLKFMTEAPNVFCSCALQHPDDIYTNMEYVAFVYTGTNDIYMNTWENLPTADDAWETAIGSPNWAAYVTEVINSGLSTNDDVELVIRATIPVGYVVNVTELDTVLVAQTNLGTDAWDTENETLLLDHTGLHDLGNNSGETFTLVSDDYFTELDDAILSSNENINVISTFEISPNPMQNEFKMTYDLRFTSSVQLTIYDLNGKLIYTQDMGSQNAGYQAMRVNLPTGILQKGLYILAIESEKERHREKIIIF